MKNYIHIVLLFIVVVAFTGCAVTKQIVGEFYLEQKKYDKGYSHFQNKIQEDAEDASSQYYYGRFLLAKKSQKEALVHLKKATLLDSKNADYYSWLGIAYSTQKQYKNERKSYLKALSLDKKHLQSLIYLAHNFFDANEYKNALTYYSKALKLQAYNKSALYNRALSLKKLGRTPEEKLAWKTYLEYYPAGKLAQNAVRFSNTLGVFDYRNHIIGLRTITLKNITFEPFDLKIDSDSRVSLNVLGEILNKNKKIQIHIVAYQQNNIVLAKQKAKTIRDYIVKKYPSIDSSRLKLSWFNKPKTFKLNKRKYILGENIDFITIIKK